MKMKDNYARICLKKKSNLKPKKPVKTTVSKQQKLPFENHCKGKYNLELNVVIYSETFIVLYFAFCHILESSEVT